MEERHKCKICPRSFSNGKALGGHMKAHLATLPLPHKTVPLFLDDSDDQEEHDSETPLIYGLRENPRKTLRFAGPGPVVQDMESEAETEPEPQPRRRPRRNWAQAHRPMEVGPEQVSEESVAMCLIMLSRDHWLGAEGRGKPVFSESRTRKVRGRYECDKCKKTFRSHQALGSHRVTHRPGHGAASRTYECPFCYKVFGSGQALGGHKRSHMLLSANATTPRKLLDLNLPAPVEEDSYSVVSDGYDPDPVRIRIRY